MKARGARLALLIVSTLSGVYTGLGVDAVHAAPVKSVIAGQRLLVQVQRTKGNKAVLRDGMKAQVVSSVLQWDYVPSSSVSIPYVDVQFAGIPIPNSLTILAERAGTLKADPKRGYVLHLPLMKTENSVLITVVDQVGGFEDWKITVTLGFTESSIFVDETCRDYSFKIRELSRPAGPNLIYVGCKPGSGPRDMSLDILWSDISRVEYRGQSIKASSSVLSVPLESKRPTTSEFIGIGPRGEKSVYEIEYQPFIPPPYEIWGGLAFFSTSFAQSNFPATFSQIGSAFVGQFWYRPEDVRLSLMVRGFGSIVPFSQKLEPDQGYQEWVGTWFLNMELRYMVLDKAGWRIDPILGGWFFFQEVKSRQFGIQRIIDPVLGVLVQKAWTPRDHVALTLRAVPLQSFFDPFRLRFDQFYGEAELTYVHALKQRNRIFGTLIYGGLNYAPEGFAQTTGSYLVLGGGYGW